MRKCFFLLFLMLPLFFVEGNSLYAKRDNKLHENILEWDSRRTDRIQELIRKDSSFAVLSDYIIMESDSYLKTSLLQRSMRGKRLLEISQEILRRNLYLAYSYHITGDDRYAQRAKKEILNVCNYSDWNPDHFLDVAEMSLAVSMGYGWLRSKFSEVEKDSVITALYNKCIEPAARLLPSKGFYGASNNWNAVCNAGVLAAAIILSEKNPEIAEKMIVSGENSNLKYIKSFQPSGASTEGYVYWGYGMDFECLFLNMLGSYRKKGINEDIMELLESSVRYIHSLNTPTLGCYDYSDSGNLARTYLVVWWIEDYSSSRLTEIDRHLIKKGIKYIGAKRLLPILIIFASRLNEKSKKQSLNKLNYFKGDNPVLTYCEDFTDKNSVYLGIKGGKASNSHAHMDAGSMIYENYGVRWLVELGSPDYYRREEEGYDLWNRKQDSSRWNVPEISPEWHSTIQIDGGRHNVEGMAYFLNREEEKNKVGEIIDMSDVLDGIKKARRGVFLDEEKNLIISDTIINGNDNHTMDWHIITEAHPIIMENGEIVLEKERKQAVMQINCDSKISQPYIEKMKYKKNKSSVEKSIYKIGIRKDFTPDEKKVVEAKLRMRVNMGVSTKHE